jgi:hypothetical protein
MKIMILALLFVCGGARASEIPESIQKIIFDEIGRLVYYEDEGAMRLPSKISDFTYKMEDEFLISVKGNSYSEWDMKDLAYDCQVKITTRGMIKSSKDIEVDCKVETENWPYWN